MSAVIQEISPAEPQYPTPDKVIGQKEHKPYPVDALPDVLRFAAREINDYVKCPFGITATNLLTMAATVSQGLAMVRRKRLLISPLSLFALIVSEPNERKSFDAGFTKTVPDKWVAEQLKRLKPDIQKHQADMMMWESQKRGINLRIQKQAKDGASEELAKSRDELERIIAAKPEPPIIPKLIYTDATHQALLDGLLRYPTGAVMTSEGGLFFGGAGMQNDSIMAAFSVYNEIWSNDAITIDRKGEGSMTVRDVALTINIAVQPEILEKFLKRTGGLARGSGFMARVLMCAPETTQGTRFEKDEPDEQGEPVDMPALMQLHDRLTELLNLQREHVTDSKRLKRTIIDLSPEAKTLLTKYYNAVEKEQGAGGELEFIRGEAGKSADNVSRIAGIFHIIEHGLDGEISADHMQRAVKVANWHLSESLRYMNDTDAPEPYKNATDLSKRLAAYCHKNKQFVVTQREIMNRCKPSSIKTVKELKPALDELLDANHIIEIKHEGRTITIAVNPRICAVHGIG